MNPFNVVSYCQSNLPSLPSLPSSLLQRRSSSSVVNVVVHTSPTTPRKHSLQQPQPTSHSPHTPITNVLEDEEEEQKPVNTVNKPRNNPQAILPEFENNDDSFYLRFAQGTNESENDLGDGKLNRHSIHTLPVSITTDNTNSDDQLKRKPLQRPISFHTVHTTPVAPERASMDSADRAKVLKPSPSDAVQATTMISQPRPMHLRHSRSNSTPSLLASSPLLKPSSTSSPSSLSTSTPNIPALSSEVNQDDGQSESEQEQPIQQPERDNSKEEEKVQVQSNLSPPQASIEVQAETSKPSFVTTPSIPTLNAPSIVPSAPVSASQPPTTEQKMSTPAPLPVAAPVPNIPVSSPTPTPSPALTLPTSTPSSTAPSTAPLIAPSTTPSTPVPAAPSVASAASSFLSSWQGRSRTMIPSLPRPSPLMSFSAARSVVNSVTSAGTGLLPSKEQLGSLPVAGRILNHPVMDSTLSYIATKASERGISLGGLNTKYLIAPEDIPYRKLNKKLVQQAMTLSVLSVQKEEQSKAIDDEAGDDAFELYLAAVNTLLHALPYETCDPLRREAFEMQLRNFMEEHLDQNMDGGYLSDTGSSVKLRRRRRRRHRQHHEQATTLIQQHTSIDEHAQSQHRGQQKQQRKQRREQHAKEQQALKKQQTLLQQQLEKEMKSQKNSKQSKQQPSSPQPSAPAHQSKGSRRSSSQQQAPCPAHSNSHSHSHSRRRHRKHNAHHQEDGRARDGVAGNNAGGFSDTIISTAVHSAIRLKQSPIPDVVKSCYQTSKTIFHKVDERFHLQDKAWEISKNSIERAIELDEQYAIHEVVTETMFATLTGLVKAGIAYKESPSYAAVRAAAAAGALEGAAPALAAAAISSVRSHNPQETTKSKRSKDLKQTDNYTAAAAAAAAAANNNNNNNNNKPSIMGSWGRRGKKTAIVESEPEYDSEDDSDEGEYDSDRSDRNSAATSSSSSTGSSSDADQDSGEGEMDDDDEVIELNQQTLRPTPKVASSAVQSDKGREKIDMFSALKGAASLVYNTL
ncbi:hypothetical protein BGX26_012576 [Mortierella sp. AD094]|nr:hypothetical protein BGX26_012576 [Mortierella sp. AD094]